MKRSNFAPRRSQFRTDERFEKTLAALQQEAILFNQQRMLQLMEKLHLSSQVKASDEFTRHDTKTQRIIHQSVLNLKHLSSKTPEYTQLTLMVGSAISSTGDLAQSEALFSQVIDNTAHDEEKAKAYFNRFQVRLRGNTFDTALADLQAAIDLNPQDYALHDVKTYPMLEILGAGGMGCVFLCQNTDPLTVQEHQKVVVKCFWETLKGAPEKVFKEAVAMRQIAGDSVPKPLAVAYANVHDQKRAYFVTEYFEGTIDGEQWLEKYGIGDDKKMDLKTGWQVALSLAQGLQVAHDKGIFHLLKPANILLRDNPTPVPLKIIDFGLAKIAPTLQQEALTRQNQSRLSQFGQAVMGTLDYAPPEQQGKTQYGEPKAYSDVFAFGATMYRFWTGLSPRRFSERKLPNVPALRELLFDCVDENPNHRPYSAGEVLERFKSIVETQRKTREDEKAWQKARGQDTKSAYEAYLKGNTLKKYASQAQQALEELEAKKQQQRFLSLSLFNPLDHLRLLWWILVMPQQFKAHKEIYGDKEQKRVGKWLVSTLIWLPLLIPTLGLGLELLPHSSKAWSANIYLLWSAGVFVCWLLTGWLGGINDEVINVPLGLAFFVMYSVALGLAGGVVAVSVAVVVAGVVAVVVMYGVADVVEESLETGTPSWIARFLFLLLIAAHLFLIGFSFLGGWRLFA